MTPADIHRLIRADELLAGSGLHIPSLAAEFGCGKQTIERLLRLLREIGQADETRQHGHPPAGEWRHHYSAGIDPLFRATRQQRGRKRTVDRAEIVRRLAAGETQAAIARDLGCPASTVGAIATGRR